MWVFNRLAAACVALARRRRTDADLNDELHAFLDASVDQKMHDGLSRRAATRAARLEIGSMAAVKDRVRDAGWESFVESIWHDVRFAFRMLRRSPGFATAAIVTHARGRDPVTFAVAALAIVVVGLIATLVPARRAIRVDPMIALRSE